MAPPTVRQVYALAAALCERSGEEFPATREVASEAIERLRAGVANAEEAIVAVDKSGPRSPVVRAIVRRLAADLSARAQGDLFRMGWQPWPPRSLGV